MLPKNGDFPSFSEFGGLQHIDDLVSYAPKDDIKGLNMLLTILAFMPKFVLKWVVGKMEKSRNMGDGGVGTLFRQLDFGIRGLVFSCYYTDKESSSYQGKNPLDVMEYSINRVEEL